MQDYLYSVIAFIAIGVHFIINMKSMFRPNKNIQKAVNKYRCLLFSIFIYYITDVLWGIFAGLNWIPVLFIDTTIYFVAMAFTIFYFYRYIVEYLDIKNWVKVLYTSFAFTFVVVELICLAVNIFYPCFFWFDELDNYICGQIRYITLWVQVGMFALSSVLMLNKIIKQCNNNTRRYFGILLFSLIMIVAIIFQEEFPLLPCYALGCMLGCCVLNVFIVGDELEEFQNIITKEKEKLEIFNEDLSEYKRAILFDALISLEINLSKNELSYGLWKDDDKKEVKLEDILGFSLPCNYDFYISNWRQKFVPDADLQLFISSTDRVKLLDYYDRGITEINFDYQAYTISGNLKWLRRNIVMIKNKNGDIISYSNVKDISAIIEQKNREEAYLRALSSEYDSIAIVSIENDKFFR